MELRLPQPGGKSALNKFSVSRDVTEKCTHYEKVATSCLIFFQTNQNVEEKNKPFKLFFVFTLLTLILPNYKGGFESVSDRLSCGPLFPLKNVPFIGESARMQL